MKMHHAALAIIFNEKGQILMSRRFEPKHKNSHNKWQFPGGGIEKGESIAEAVIREVMEEANITIDLLLEAPIEIIETINKARQEYITLHGFPSQYVSGTISCENDPESSEIRWFDYEDVDFNNSLSGTKRLTDESLKLIQTLWTKN